MQSPAFNIDGDAPGTDHSGERELHARRTRVLHSLPNNEPTFSYLTRLAASEPSLVSDAFPEGVVLSDGERISVRLGHAHRLRYYAAGRIGWAKDLEEQARKARAQAASAFRKAEQLAMIEGMTEVEKYREGSWCSRMVDASLKNWSEERCHAKSGRPKLPSIYIGKLGDTPFVRGRGKKDEASTVHGAGRAFQSMRGGGASRGRGGAQELDVVRVPAPPAVGHSATQTHGAPTGVTGFVSTLAHDAKSGEESSGEE